MARNQGGLEHHMPEQPSPSPNCTFAAHRAAVMGNRRQSAQAPVSAAACAPVIWPRALPVYLESFLRCLSLRSNAKNDNVCFNENWKCFNSGISAINIVLATGPIPGTERSILTVLVRLASSVMSCSIRFSSSPIWRSSNPLSSWSMIANISADPSFSGALICAKSRLRVSTIYPRFDTKPLIRRVFYVGVPAPHLA